MICLDTTYFIDMIRNPSAIAEITKKIDERGRAATTVFNVFEAYIGSFGVKDKEREEKIKDKLNKAFRRLEILDFAYNDAIKAAEIGGTLLKTGRGIGADAITAAIAVNNGCSAIVTKNVVHFKAIKQITGLDIIEY